MLCIAMYKVCVVYLLFVYSCSCSCSGCSFVRTREASLVLCCQKERLQYSTQQVPTDGGRDESNHHPRHCLRRRRRLRLYY
jgi:hypothetical protein